MTKTILPSIQIIQGLSDEQTFTFKHPNHPDVELVIRVTKVGKKFTFVSENPIPTLLYDFDNWRFSKEQVIEFTGENSTFFCQGNDFILRSRSFDNLIISGDIYGLRSKQDHNDEESFYRYISQIKKGDLELGDFQGSRFQENLGGKSHNYFFIQITLQDDEFHLYSYSYDDIHYLIIDSTKKKTLSDFKTACYNVLLSYAVMKGILFNDEAFIIEYENQELSKSISLTFISLGETIRTEEPIVTTNFYTLFGEDKSIEIIAPKGKHILTTSDIGYFSQEILSNLVVLNSKHEKIQRASLLFISSQRTTIEMKIPILYVALEAITGTVVDLKKAEGEKSNFAPIKDKVIADELISELRSILQSKKEMLNIPDQDFDVKPLLAKLNYLNAPPNANKLKGAFDYVGFDLAEEDFEIIKNRDKFLHGNFVRGIGDEELFIEALHASLKISHLIGVLLLKLSNYKGPMLNYPARYSYMTGKSTNESTVIVL